MSEITHYVLSKTLNSVHLLTYSHTDATGLVNWFIGNVVLIAAPGVQVRLLPSV